MIRSTDLDSFVCCAVCSKIIPPPPSDATFDRIREYVPFRTRYYTHRDILEIGASIQQEERERKEAEMQECIEKMKAELWSQAEKNKEDAVNKALREASANHSMFVKDLTLKLKKEIKEAVRKAEAEMKAYMEEVQRREIEATEQRMAHKLWCALQECHKEKMEAVAKARNQEREMALNEAATQYRKQIEKLIEESTLAKELHHKTIEQLNKQKYEMNIALSIKQKENQLEMEKQRKELETVHLDQLEKVMTTLKEAEDQVKTLQQKLEKMRAWKDNLETEIQATRQAFQRYIDVTFSDLSPGQADFILPFRMTFEPNDIPEEAEGSVSESHSHK
ncbi:uncharacterized protein C6orf163 homolog [Cyrtonyx montezumae]|uniref:uncharacterized protein C6orf163 homolog n=1 Tax=Cyrtonyx montezumae TaxID=9017 RepID=UPI0032DABF4B